MSTAARRSAWLKLRVTPKEKEAITAKATMQGQTVTDFLRQRALDYRLRQTPLEKERIRQLARIGANLNQLARWANTWQSRAEAVFFRPQQSRHRQIASRFQLTVGLDFNPPAQSVRD